MANLNKHFYSYNMFGDKLWKITNFPLAEELRLPFYLSTFGKAYEESDIHWPPANKCFIVYSQKGCGQAFVKGVWQPLPEGTAVYFPSNVEIMYKPMDGTRWDTVFITFSGRYAESMLGAEVCLISGENLSFIPALVDEMREAYGGDSWQEDKQLLLYKLLLRVGKFTQLNTADAKDLAVTDRIKLSVKYITEHFGEDIPLSTLAGMSNIREEYYCRLFKELTGVNPTTYINSLRISRACDLLYQYPGRKIEEISTECGFRKQSYFNKLFKQEIGVTPTQFRAKNKKQP